MNVMRIMIFTLIVSFIPFTLFAKDKVFKADFRQRPPLMVIDDNSNLSGPLKTILEEAAGNIGYTVEWRIAPFKRSLGEVKVGSVDIVPRYRENTKRKSFTNYLGPIGYQVRETLFVVSKNSGVAVKSYEDLQKYEIGVKRGTYYFKQFNDDNKINKREVIDDGQLVRMLKARRYDAVIVIDEAAFLDAAKTNIFSDWEYAEYKYSQKLPNYYGMSKNSPHADAYPALNKVLQEMTKTGRVAEIFRSFNVEPLAR